MIHLVEQKISHMKRKRLVQTDVVAGGGALAERLNHTHHMIKGSSKQTPV